MPICVLAVLAAALATAHCQQTLLGAQGAIKRDECRTTLHRSFTLVTHTRRMARGLRAAQQELAPGRCARSGMWAELWG